MAGFDFGQVKDIVNDGEQRLSCRPENTNKVLLFCREFGICQHFRHTNDGI